MSDPTLPPVRMRYSLESRCRVVQAVLDGATPQEAALAHGASRSSVYRWWVRYRAAGWASLRDRPCTPHRQPRRLSREAEAEIIAVRERSGGGPEVVGAIVDRPASTVGKVLRRLGYSRLPKPPRLCYQKMSSARMSRGETLVLVMQPAQDRSTHDLALAPGR